MSPSRSFSPPVIVITVVTTRPLSTSVSRSTNSEAPTIFSTSSTRSSENPSDPSQSPYQSTGGNAKPKNVGGIVGGVLGGLALIGALVAAAIIFLRRRKAPADLQAYTAVETKSQFVDPAPAELPASNDELITHQPHAASAIYQLPTHPNDLPELITHKK